MFLRICCWCGPGLSELIPSDDAKKRRNALPQRRRQIQEGYRIKIKMVHVTLTTSLSQELAIFGLVFATVNLRAEFEVSINTVHEGDEKCRKLEDLR